MKKTAKQIRNELLSAYFSLEEVYERECNHAVEHHRIDYLQLEFANHLLNALKALEYHYRDDRPEMRTKKKWGEEMKRAHVLLKKYAENEEAENPLSKLSLKSEFDDTGYLSHKEWIHEMSTKRKELKRMR
jgi:hypothetical protein